MRKFAAIYILFPLLLSPQPALAVITTIGSIDPADPNTWADSTYAYVGKDSDAALTVDGGSEIISKNVFVAYFPRTAGEVTVDGTGSTWTNSETLTIGQYGEGVVNITNGGMLDSNKTYIGRHFNSSGKVTVEGVGSLWENSNVLCIGNSSQGELVITDGGEVNSNEVTIGCAFGSTGNVFVEGTGSAWTNLLGFSIGMFGTGSIHITDGGTVSSMDNCVIGDKAGSTGTVVVAGANSKWTNQGELYVGSSGSGSMSITDGAQADFQGNVWAACKAGGEGSIHLDGGTLSMTGAMLVGETQLTGTGTINACGIVTDVDMFLSTPADLTQTLTYDDLPNQNIAVNLDIQTPPEQLGAGYAGTGSLTINNGMDISSGYGILGYQPGSKGTVNVDGTNSTWSITLVEGNNYSKALVVGYEGNGILNITNGGVLNTEDVNSWGTIGRQADSVGQVTVQNAGSSLSISNYLSVGYEGNGTLNILDGGTVNSNYGRLGCMEGSNGEVTIDGNGSAWIINHSLSVGARGYGKLNITNGGLVRSNGGGVSSFQGVDSEASISGSGSKWENHGNLGVSGILNITDGGLVASSESHISSSNEGSSALITVDGNNSALTGGSIYVGDTRTGNLTITDGGQVNSYHGYIGHEVDSTGNVTIDGTNSTWTNYTELHVGYSGSGILNIKNNGLVDVQGNTWIAYNGGSEGKINFDHGTLTTKSLMAAAQPGQLSGTGTINTNGLVSDVDLVFESTGDLTKTITLDSQPGQNITVNLNVNGQGALGAGYNSQGSMTIRNGLEVVSSEGCIGYRAGSTGEVNVEGFGTKWTNNGNLHIGTEGTGTLTISDGALVSVAGKLKIDPSDNGGSFINISNGGMLAIKINSTWPWNVALGNTNEIAISVLQNDINAVNRVDIFSSIDTAFTTTPQDSSGITITLIDDIRPGIPISNWYLENFLDHVDGHGKIRGWDQATGDWVPLSSTTTLNYTVEYQEEGDLAGYTILTVGYLPSDANGDGMVNGSDVTILANNWLASSDNQTLTWEMGDFNGDGIVDGSDVTTLAANWQNGVPTFANAVPEPSVVLLLLALTLLAPVVKRIST